MQWLGTCFVNAHLISNPWHLQLKWIIDLENSLCSQRLRRAPVSQYRQYQWSDGLRQFHMFIHVHLTFLLQPRALIHLLHLYFSFLTETQSELHK